MSNNRSRLAPPCILQITKLSLSIMENNVTIIEIISRFDLLCLWEETISIACLVISGLNLIFHCLAKLVIAYKCYKFSRICELVMLMSVTVGYSEKSLMFERIPSERSLI